MRSSFLRTRAVTIAVAIGAIAFPAAADAAKPKKPAKVDVMTRNLYLGADLGPAIAAPTPPQAYTAVGNIYKKMQDMNFNARAKLLAKEIGDTSPDLIGLQEVSLWRRDDVVDGPTTPAQEVVYDYLELLMDELQGRGLYYDVVVVQQEADLEFPADTRGGTNGGPNGSPDFDARLTMRDVILAKRGTKIKEAAGANYSTNVAINTAAFGPVQVLRGFTYADVVPNKGKKFRFVNTHLESFSAYFRNKQAQELTGGSGVTAVSWPIVLVGDLNSDPDDPGSSPPPAPRRRPPTTQSSLTALLTAAWRWTPAALERTSAIRRRRSRRESTMYSARAR